MWHRCIAAAADTHYQQRLPQFKGGKDTRFSQQVWISPEMRGDLRRVGAALDRSCPTLIREAIGDLLAGTGIPRQTSPSKRREDCINQTAVIAREARDQLRQTAFDHHCSPGDLVRGAIDDLLLKYADLIGTGNGGGAA